MNTDTPLGAGQAEGGMSSTEVELVQRELEAKYRLELNRKLDEVNIYLEEQSRRRSALDQSTQEKETRLMAERRRMEVRDGFTVELNMLAYLIQPYTIRMFISNHKFNLQVRLRSSFVK